MIDFTQFTTDLSMYGTVIYCGYNDTDVTKLIVKMIDITNTISSIIQINTIISNYTASTHPNIIENQTANNSFTMFLSM